MEIISIKWKYSQESHIGLSHESDRKYNLTNVNYLPIL